jgi:hypothetical protein
VLDGCHLSAVHSTCLPALESEIFTYVHHLATAAPAIQRQQQQQQQPGQPQQTPHAAIDQGYGNVHTTANANASRAVLGALQALQHKVVTLEGERNRLEMKLAVSEVRFDQPPHLSDELYCAGSLTSLWSVQAAREHALVTAGKVNTVRSEGQKMAEEVEVRNRMLQREFQAEMQERISQVTARHQAELDDLKRYVNCFAALNARDCSP